MYIIGPFFYCVILVVIKDPSGQTLPQILRKRELRALGLPFYRVKNFPRVGGSPLIDTPWISGGCSVDIPSALIPILVCLCYLPCALPITSAIPGYSWHYKLAQIEQIRNTN